MAGLVALAVVMLPACYYPTRAADTRFRAEYRCAQIRSEMLGAGAIRVTGCGRRTTYVCQDDMSHGTVCVREREEELTPAEPAPTSSRLALEGTSIDGSYAVRLRIEPGPIALEYAPARALDTIAVVGEPCARFALRHPGGTVGDVESGLSLLDLAALRPSDQVEILACDATVALNATERGELDRFIAHALRLRRERHD
ncbi:MAG: hypothetical protein K8H88_09015 [Sandaracinaceae bacterium]|nr:hypothetical protein [Sandaracinaceae bacterium]